MLEPDPGRQGHCLYPVSFVFPFLTYLSLDNAAFTNTREALDPQFFLNSAFFPNLRTLVFDNNGNLAVPDFSSLAPLLERFYFRGNIPTNLPTFPSLKHVHISLEYEEGLLSLTRLLQGSSRLKTLHIHILPYDVFYRPELLSPVTELMKDLEMLYITGPSNLRVPLTKDEMSLKKLWGEAGIPVLVMSVRSYWLEEEVGKWIEVTGDVQKGRFTKWVRPEVEDEDEEDRMTQLVGAMGRHQVWHSMP